MTRQGAKEMMLQGKKVTHTTFESNEYAYMDSSCIIKLNSNKTFFWFYSDIRYKTGWAEYQEEKQNNMKYYTIDDLKEGRVAIQYGLDNIHLLTRVLKKAFPKHIEPMGTCRYYLQRTNTETWLASESKPTIPVQKLEYFEESLTDKRFPFQLSIDDARKIIGIACQEWQKKLLSKWDKVLITGFVQVDEDFYTEMRAACTREQNELFDKIFGEDYSIEWKPNHVYIVDAGAGKALRVSSNNIGYFYANGYFEGNTIKYSSNRIIKIIGPV